MSDITKCTGDGCLFAEDCWRFKAPENPIQQSYFAKPPHKDGKCSYLWLLRQPETDGPDNG